MRKSMQLSGVCILKNSNAAKTEEVPTFAMLQQFQVAEQVTCHNSGKSLWLDL